MPGPGSHAEQVRSGALPRAAAGFVVGFLVTVAACFGLAAVLNHGRANAGSAVTVSRGYSATYTRSFGLTEHYPVLLRFPGGATTFADSKALYDLVGPSARHIAVQVETDTSDHTISRVRADGRWLTISSPSPVSLIIIVPALILGLAVLIPSLIALVVAAYRGVHLASRRGQIIAVVLGLAAVIFGGALDYVGFAYPYGTDVGHGVVYGPTVRTLASANHLQVLPSVQLHADWGENDTLTQSDLYRRLLAAPAGTKLDVRVYTNSKGDVSGLQYHGSMYGTIPLGWASDLIVGVLMLGVAVLGLVAVVGNGRALMRGRRGVVAVAS